MKIGSALLGFSFVTLLYFGALIYIDRENDVFEHGIDLAGVLPQVALFALASFLLRFVRWRWMLGRRNYHIPVWQGLLAYLSGFALTASPGKVGELLRARYFGAMGVPLDQVIACFVFERTLDLIAVLLLSILFAGFASQLPLVFAFVALVVIAVIALSRVATRLTLIGQWLQEVGWHSPARLSRAAAEGFSGAISFFRPVEFAGALVLGLLAWGVQSLGCVYLLLTLDISMPTLAAVALYPLALLIGAASMLPGGIGTTEAAIVLLLHDFGAPFARATLAAVGMRLSTLWFAMLLGLMAILILEFRKRRS
jgi:uncharacterized protein (TIRG00374 family)